MGGGLSKKRGKGVGVAKKETNFGRRKKSRSVGEKKEHCKRPNYKLKGGKRGAASLTLNGAIMKKHSAKEGCRKKWGTKIDQTGGTR